MKRLLSLALWLLTGLAVVILALVVIIPRVAGWVPLTVLSGSMEPTIRTGSMVVVEQVNGEEDLQPIEVGDVITFMPFPDDPTLVTHRVISQGQRADGGLVFVTQGDANSSPDDQPVGAQQIRGIVRYDVPYVGHLSSLLNSEHKRFGVAVVAVLLFGYAGFQGLRARQASRSSRAVLPEE